MSTDHYSPGPGSPTATRDTATHKTHLKFTLLGSGSSGGVPRVGNQWGHCDPDNPRNRRRRCALLVEQQLEDGTATTVVIDAGADLREQLLGAAVIHLDGVLLTHPHADHIFGLDDLRQLALFMGQSIPVHMDAATSSIVMRGFGYCFRQAPGSSYPSFCTERRITHPGEIAIDGAAGALRIHSLKAEHGDIHALGFRIGGLAYLPDIKKLADESSRERLRNLDILIIDALRYKRHPTHMNLDEALAFIEDIQPSQAILTNMHSDLDYETLVQTLPRSVEPGYDGMELSLPDHGEQTAA